MTLQVKTGPTNPGLPYMLNTIGVLLELFDNDRDQLWVLSDTNKKYDGVQVLKMGK